MPDSSFIPQLMINSVNPPSWDAACGFDPEKEERLPTMLAFKDVHAPQPAGDPQ